MSESTLTFKCLGHIRQYDGSVGRYDLGVTDARNDETAKISVAPKHLASARSMHTVLLERCMVYSVTQKAHERMLLEMFAHADGQAEIADSRWVEGRASRVHTCGKECKRGGRK